jgi:hypothetical protein
MSEVMTINNVPEISTQWSHADYIGTLKVRSALGRKRYLVKPGLYKIGNPNKKSEVFISANYKLSFDILRKNLSGIDSWVLVLDTKGINVWCAAGKGTFGTAELIRRINSSKLYDLVNHRRLILPQLSAPGISGHSVKEKTGFKVIFGPVRASDIKQFLESGYKASEPMRTVRFSFRDRLILTPVEMFNSIIYLAFVIVFFFILSGLSSEGYFFNMAIKQGITSAILIIAAYLSGAFLTPILLPWLPFRYFAAKGMIMSGVTFLMLIFTKVVDLNLFLTIGWFLISLGIASFLAMNFTGASTFTSLSGVKKEMRIFVPVQVLFSSTGLLLIILSNFLL